MMIFFLKKYYFSALENVSAEETAVVLDLDQANKTGGWDDTVDLVADKKALPIVFSARIASSHKRKKKKKNSILDGFEVQGRSSSRLPLDRP